MNTFKYFLVSTVLLTLAMIIWGISSPTLILSAKTQGVATSDSILIEVEGILTNDKIEPYVLWPKVWIEGFGPKVEVNEFNRFYIKTRIPKRYKHYYIRVHSSQTYSISFVQEVGTGIYSDLIRIPIVLK